MCEVIHHWSSDMHSLMTSDVGLLFMYLYIFFGKMSVGILCPFFKWIISFFFFLAIEFYEFLIFWILTTYWLMVYKYFPPFHRLPFHFLMVSFTVQKFPRLMWSNLWVFAFIACAFSIKKKKKEKRTVETNAKELPPSFSPRDFMISGLTFKSKSILSSFFVLNR